MHGLNSKTGDSQGKWHHDPYSQLFWDAAQWEDDPTARHYTHQLHRAKDERFGFGFDTVLCVEGQPTVYFKSVKSKSPEQERDWHRAVWNQGTATLLVVEDPNDVRVYSALAQPKPELILDSDNRFVTKLNRIADALELRNFIRSVETGEFFRNHAHKLQTDRPVDHYLLDNLRAARDLLCNQTLPDALDFDIAHAFLGRSLFTCYLLERGIIGKEHLKAVGAPIATKLWLVLDQLTKEASRTKATDILFELFQLLHEDFNGSMFGGNFASERKTIRVRHLDVLRDFLRGDDLKLRQPTLGFSVYDFRFIPIELISSIYESFLAQEINQITPEQSEDKPSKTRRRQSGAYYTPPRLAELVVNIATKEWDTFLGKRCLDPSCGSGIFLVILFQRMAEEWRRKNREATTVERAMALREFLTNSICGIDNNETACLVACFSLYLAFMDQFDPPDIWALKEALARRHTRGNSEYEEKVLPQLMPESKEIADGVRPVIYPKNFFCPELDNLGPFDLIIGNPPWFGRQQKSDSEMEAWLFSNRNPLYKNSIQETAQRKVLLLPSDQSATAFMWKAPLHSIDEKRGPHGEICLLVPSRIFLANQTNVFQTAFFKNFRVQDVWMLADYRFILFEGADCPATVVRYLPSPPTKNDEVISYIVPKVQRADPQHSMIVVLPEDDKSLLVTEILSAATKQQAFQYWKKHLWGTPRDVRFIDRLLGMPKLEQHAGPPGSSRKPWVKGAGFQPISKSTTKPQKSFWRPSDLYLNANKQIPGSILLDRDCEKIGSRWEKVHRKRNPSIFKAPLVVFNKGANKFLFAGFDVYFQDAFQSIACPPEEEDSLLMATAALQSDLAQYYWFHTSANIGVERDIVRIQEFLDLPFPRPENLKKPNLARDIAHKVADLIRQHKNKLESMSRQNHPFFDPKREELAAAMREELNTLVVEYYDLSSRERILLDDTLAVSRKSATPHSLNSEIGTLRSSRFEERKIYSDYFCRTVNGWAYRSKEKLQARGCVCLNSGLCLISLSRSSQPKSYSETEVNAEFEAVLKRIADEAQAKYPGIIYLRGFSLIEDTAIHILKPLAYRHWTRTMALNDADEIMGELMFLKKEY